MPVFTRIQSIYNASHYTLCTCRLVCMYRRWSCSGICRNLGEINTNSIRRVAPGQYAHIPCSLILTMSTTVNHYQPLFNHCQPLSATVNHCQPLSTTVQPLTNNGSTTVNHCSTIQPLSTNLNHVAEFDYSLHAVACSGFWWRFSTSKTRFKCQSILLLLTNLHIVEN